MTLLLIKFNERIRIKLSPESDIDVDKVYPGGLPSVLGRMSLNLEASDVRLPEEKPSVNTEKPELQAVVIQELAETARSMRSSARPSSILHALLLEDNMTLARVAGVTRMRVSDVELALLLLSDAGWVQRRQISDEAFYSIRGLPIEE